MVDTSGVDLSAFSTEDGPQVEDSDEEEQIVSHAGPQDPGPVPDSLLRVPGFIGQVMDHCLKTAPHPNHVMAFCAAMSLQGLLAGRKVRDEANNRTSLYLLGLANSGVGKDHPRKINQEVLALGGRTIKTVSYESLHNESAAGINLDSNPKDFARKFNYQWFEPLTGRLVTKAGYGSGDVNWGYGAEPAYASFTARPTVSTTGQLLVSYTYSKGRLETVTDPNGRSEKKYYDGLGRTTKVEDRDEAQQVKRVTLTVFDGLSNVTQQVADLNHNGVVDTTDQVTTYGFGDSVDASLKTSIQYPDGNSTCDRVTFAYNLDGTIASRTAQKSQQYEASTDLVYSYDSLRRMTEEHVQSLGTDVDGTVRSIQTGRDSLGRVNSIQTFGLGSSPSNEVRYEYSEVGSMVAEYQEHCGAVTGTSKVVRYAFDNTQATYNGISGVYVNANRPDYVQYPNGRKSFSSFGASGSLSSKLSRLDAIVDDNGTGNPGNALASYQYGGVSRMISEEFAEPSVRLDRFGSTSSVYDGFDRFGRIAQQRWSRQGTDREKINYEYDFNSNRKLRENVVAAAAGRKWDELYVHDALNRLVDFKRGRVNAGHTDIPLAGGDRVRREEWTLSDTDNWNAYNVDANGDGDYIGTQGDELSQTRTHNLANEISGISEISGQTHWQDPTCDARGNMTIVLAPRNPTQGLACYYDAWNRLTKVVSGSQTVMMRYDGIGRRVRKYSVADPGYEATVNDYYYNCSWQLLEVRKDVKTWSWTAGYEPSLANPVYEQYVWSARYIDAPVLRDRDTGTGGDLGTIGSGLDERLYYLTDAHMNVTCLVNTAGQAVERYYYDPYGKMHVLDGSTGGQTDWADDADNESDVDNDVLFSGYQRDFETGLYNVRNRVYHPLLGRWLQRDPLGYVSGMSMYGYYGQVTYRDPSGLCPDGGGDPGGPGEGLTGTDPDDPDDPGTDPDDPDDPGTDPGTDPDNGGQSNPPPPVNYGDPLGGGGLGEFVKDQSQASPKECTENTIANAADRGPMMAMGPMLQSDVYDGTSLIDNTCGRPVFSDTPDALHGPTMTPQLGGSLVVGVASPLIALAPGAAVVTGTLVGKALLKKLAAKAAAKAAAKQAAKDAAKSVCFPADTAVVTEFGQKAIQDIKAGENVWACDPQSGQWQLTEVVAPLIHDYDGDLVSLTTGVNEIRATGNHPFWVVSGNGLAERPAAQDVYAGERGITMKGRWVEARDLRIGDVLSLVSGKTAAISEVTRTQVHLKVYNIEVGGVHTYAVGKAGVLVHNKPMENPRQWTKLTKGEIKQLKDRGIDPEELKPNSKYDLFKDTKGDIHVKPKDGSGPGDPTNLNIKQ